MSPIDPPSNPEFVWESVEEGPVPAGRRQVAIRPMGTGSTGVNSGHFLIITLASGRSPKGHESTGLGHQSNSDFKCSSTHSARIGTLYPPSRTLTILPSQYSLATS